MFRSTESPVTKEVVLRFHNDTSTALRVLWCDHGGHETEYAVLRPGTAYNQSTYSTHAWRLREVTLGTPVCEYAGETATITVAEDGTATIKPGLCLDSGSSTAVHPEWGVYRTRANALGIPIKAYDCVGEEAVTLAMHTLESMLADVDASIVQLMCERGAELAIIGKDQVTTDIPPHSHLKGQQCAGEERTYDDGTRGLGGNLANPTTSVGEENVTMVGDQLYHSESILVHEFAHAVMDIGLHGHPLQEAIRRAHQNALAKGLHDPACYMMANACEYWAEGTQAWFDATVRTDVTSGVNTRDKLKRKDPELAAIMTTVYGDGPWRYPLTGPRPFGPCSPTPYAARASAGAMACVHATPSPGGGAQRAPDRPLHRPTLSGGGAKDLESGVTLEVDGSAIAVVGPMRRDSGKGQRGAGEAAPLLAAAVLSHGWRLLGLLSSCCACCSCGCCGALRWPLGALAAAEEQQVPLRTDAAGQHDPSSTPNKGRGAYRKMLSLMRRAGLRSPRVPNSPKGQ